VLIPLVTVAAFLPTLHNQFVGWNDDDDNLVDNLHYRGLGWPQLRWMWTTFHVGHYMPLTWMTFGLDYLFWGMKPSGYHLTSLVLHAANATVFYLMARRLLGVALPGPGERGQGALALSAAFAALLFALHPLRVESVAWATERRDVLSALFYLLTILLYLRAREWGESGRRWYWLSVGVFACALLSKSMAVSLPVVLLILDVYPLRRLGGAVGWLGEAARRVYTEKIPFVLLALAASAIAFLALVRLRNMASMAQLSVLDRLAVSAYALSFYLWKMILPLDLSPLYELSKPNPWATPFLLGYGAVFGLTALALSARRRLPGFAAAGLAYVVTLLPVLGIFQNGPQIAADRYTYLAGLGWAILAGAGLLACWHATRFLLLGPAVCVLVGLALLTWNQVQVWHDPEKLWSHAIAIDPESSMAHTGLGLALTEQGKPAEAVEHFRQALRLKPDLAETHHNLGLALARQGELAQAIDRFQQALRLKPDYADAHNNWGSVLADQGKLAEAIEHYRQALHLKPEYGAAHYNLGTALARQGKPAEAAEHYRRALEIKPNYAGALNNWGNTLTELGKLAEAVELYRRALTIKPDYADAHHNLGVALARQGKPAEAIEHYRQALTIKPDLADAYQNWGNALTQLGKPAEAAEHYRQALKIKPDYAEALTNWGLALAQQGKPAEAIEHYQRALEIRPDYADAHQNWGNALAQQGKPAEAIEHYRKALAIKPNFAEALNNWGVALAQQGKSVEAIEHFRRALKIRPDYADAHRNLGVALAQQGKPAAAGEHSQRALPIGPAGPSNTTSTP
jgi:Tfp pilus assembly protein PilF